MTRPLTAMHPTFDALSAYADRTDLEGARSRTGRHVACCAECRDAIIDIRALGDAARAMKSDAAPPDLWDRILEDRRIVGRRHEGLVDMTVPAAPHNVPTRMWRTMSILAAAAAIIAAVALSLGARRTLVAATPRRLVLAQPFAAPGARISVRYRPVPALAGQHELTVWASYRNMDERRHPRNDARLVRAGLLRRESAQLYTGTVSLPDGALAAGFVVGDSAGEVIDRSDAGSGQFLATVIAADRAGRPRFDALVAYLDEVRRFAPRADVASAGNAMTIHYPDRPETWLLTYRMPGRGVVRDFVIAFLSFERAYIGWHEKLERRTGLSAQTEAMMAEMGRELDDTERADFWIERLLREHPADGRGQELWISRRRHVPQDSVAIVLAAFESLWLRANGNARMIDAATALAERSGDPTLRATWSARLAPVRPAWIGEVGADPFPSDSAALEKVERQLVANLDALTRDSLGTPTLWRTARQDARFSRFRRQRIETRLAAIQLLRGDARGARAALDRIRLASVSEGAGCPFPETIRWRAEASLRLGDTVSAREDLAYLATTQNWRVAAVADSAPRLLGDSFSTESWSAAMTRAAEEHRRCFALGRSRAAAER